MEAEDERNRKMDEILKLDERKRGYNSLNLNNAEPTEEEMEAYRMKRPRQDDPMAQFMKKKRWRGSPAPIRPTLSTATSGAGGWIPCSKYLFHLLLSISFLFINLMNETLFFIIFTSLWLDYSNFIIFLEKKLFKHLL